jgi:hypothetical protein
VIPLLSHLLFVAAAARSGPTPVLACAMRADFLFFLWCCSLNLTVANLDGSPASAGAMKTELVTAVSFALTHTALHRAELAGLNTAPAAMFCTGFVGMGVGAHSSDRTFCS